MTVDFMYLYPTRPLVLGICEWSRELDPYFPNFTSNWIYFAILKEKQLTSRRRATLESFRCSFYLISIFFLLFYLKIRGWFRNIFFVFTKKTHWGEIWQHKIYLTPWITRISSVLAAASYKYMLIPAATAIAPTPRPAGLGRAFFTPYFIKFLII